MVRGVKNNKKIPCEKESHFVKTNDGWTIHLMRRKPHEKIFKYPLLLIHGFGQNRYTWEPPASSFAPWFSSKGMDVWILELRGSGKSKIKGKMNWTFEDFLTKDLPSAVSYIKKKTETEKLFFCGHSLGGTLIYCYTSFNEKNVKGFISLAGPVYYGRDSFYMKLGGIYASIPEAITGKTIIEYMPYFPLREMGMAGLVFYPLFNTFIESLVPLHPWHRKNVNYFRLASRILLGFERVSPSLASQLVLWISRDGLFSHDFKINYLKYIPKIKAPCLFIAGSCDRLAPPASVKPAFDMVSSRDKKFIVLTSKTHKVDWGHLDLTMGRHCEDVLYPILLNWIKEHAE